MYFKYTLPAYNLLYPNDLSNIYLKMILRVLVFEEIFDRTNKCNWWLCVEDEALSLLIDIIFTIDANNLFSFFSAS